MHDKYPKGNYIYLIAILIAATIITIISTVLTYKNSLKAAEDSLKKQMKKAGLRKGGEGDEKGNKLEGAQNA